MVSSEGKGVMGWEEPVSGFAHSCLLRTYSWALSHTLLRYFMEKQICHDLWRMEIHSWISPQGFLIIIMGATQKRWELLAKIPSYRRRLEGAGQLWKFSNAGGMASVGSNPDRQRLLRCLQQRWRMPRNTVECLWHSLFWDNLKLERWICKLFLADTHRQQWDAEFTKVTDK